MALHVACRLALIAFATVAIRGVLDRSDFEATLHAGLLVGAILFAVGLVIGDLARRLIEDTVHRDVDRVLEEVTHLDRVEHSSQLAQPA